MPAVASVWAVASPIADIVVVTAAAGGEHDGHDGAECHRSDPCSAPRLNDPVDDPSGELLDVLCVIGLPMAFRRAARHVGSRATLDLSMPQQRDILDEYAESKKPTRYPSVEVAVGLVVEDRASGFCGDVVRWNAEAVTLRDRRQHLRHFTWKPGGFLLEGRPVTLRSPDVAHPVVRQTITASGSIAGDRSASRKVAAANRIWVEGRHDAELVEHVWGDDLRELGVVVEPMHGADDLAERVAGFGPGPGRRLGVLLDHLVAGSKESRLAAAVRSDHVLVTGHPFVDVWAGIEPRVLGLAEWPDIAPGVPWKDGMCRALGVEPEGFWPHLRNRVHTYADLRPELVGAVERLIDFVT